MQLGLMKNDAEFISSNLFASNISSKLATLLRNAMQLGLMKDDVEFISSNLIVSNDVEFISSNLIVSKRV